jgi:hypothetical protein
MGFNPSVPFRIKISAFNVHGKYPEGTKYLEPSLNDAFEDLNGGQGDIFEKETNVQIVTTHLKENSCFRTKNIRFVYMNETYWPSFPSP